MALLETALSAHEAAQRLGIDVSRVHERLLPPASLYGFKDHRDEWVLPAFQFTDTGELPGIVEVFKRLDPTLHPISVSTWFHTPNTDLFIDLETEEPVSPLRWLAVGHDPGPVAELASML